MFSKSKINDPIDPTRSDADASPSEPAAPQRAASPTPAPQGRQPKPAPSIISSDLVIKGNLETTGDMQIEGTIDGDIRSHLLTIGQAALVKGEIVADDVVVNGRVVGQIRGHKIRLSSTARVEGDIIHKNIAIENGAQFEGSVQRSEDPTGQAAAARRPTATSPSAVTTSSPAVAAPIKAAGEPSAS